MNFQITHTTKYVYSDAVPVCHNLVHLAPRSLPHQTRLAFGLIVHPDAGGISHRTDYFGNRVSCFSIDKAHRGLTVTAKSRVRVTPQKAPSQAAMPWEDVVEQLRGAKTMELVDAFQFAFPSPGVRPFAALTDYARVSFPTGRSLLEGVLELTARINEDFTYDPRATTIHTPLKEVLDKRHGVCQDFAHLQIGCLRSMGLAARYVSGYLRTTPPPGKPRLVGADASHAWLSVYCGENGWVDVDPTNDALVSSDYITVAWGRDYNDVCPIRGIIIGGVDHKMSVSVDVAPDES